MDFLQSIDPIVPYVALIASFYSIYIVKRKEWERIMVEFEIDDKPSKFESSYKPIYFVVKITNRHDTKQ